jgi:hypothetical protein
MMADNSVITHKRGYPIRSGAKKMCAEQVQHCVPGKSKNDIGSNG